MLAFPSKILTFSNCFTSVFPNPIAVYPLDIYSKTSDIRGRNTQGISYSIRYYPGPYYRPNKSTYFYGRRSSLIRFPNNGRLNTKSSITLIAWVYPESSGQIFEFMRGVNLRASRSDTLYFRVDPRQPALTGRVLRPKKWNYIAATYSARTETATLWLDSIPVAHRRIRKSVLKTDGSAYMGRYFKGRIMCMQVYKVALHRRQLEKLKHLCTRPGMLDNPTHFDKNLNKFSEDFHVSHVCCQVHYCQRF